MKKERERKIDMKWEIERDMKCSERKGTLLCQRNNISNPVPGKWLKERRNQKTKKLNKMWEWEIEKIGRAD